MVLFGSSLVIFSYEVQPYLSQRVIKWKNSFFPQFENPSFKSLSFSFFSLSVSPGAPGFNKALFSFSSSLSSSSTLKNWWSYPPLAIAHQPLSFFFSLPAVFEWKTDW